LIAGQADESPWRRIPERGRFPMIARLQWKGRELEVDLAAGEPVAVPVDPNAGHPLFFVDQRARAKPLRAGLFLGDMGQGGTCNAEMIELAPHCHGTHTECIGHVVPERRTVQATIYQQPCAARLVTVSGTRASRTVESYPVVQEPDELLITRKELRAAVSDVVSIGVEALLIRTRPNDPDKLTRDYSRFAHFPVLSSEAMHWLAVQPLRHLLLDTPSLDRGDDRGRLANHRTWWGLDATVPEDNTDASRRSVTEMVYVPSRVRDGLYWLNIELSPLVSDATPSRPVLYPLTVMPA
jgi:kynurenine formamidase